MAWCITSPRRVERTMPQLEAVAKPKAKLTGQCEPEIVVQWIEYLEYYREKDQQRLAALESEVSTLTQRMTMSDANVTKLQADLDALKTDVTNTIANLKAQLAAALASAGQTPADVTAALQAMDAEVTALDAAVNPPAPAPAPAPAPSPTP